MLAAIPSSHRAAGALEEVFGDLTGSFAFRLWDGRVVAIGPTAPAFTVVIKSPQTFFRLLRAPTPRNFAEAFVESAIDIEGDLFAAMTVADEVEELKLPPARRLRILASLWKP